MADPQQPVQGQPPQRQTPSGGKPTSTTTRALLLITALGATAFLSSVGLVMWLVTHEDAGEVQEGSFLRVKLAGPLADSPIQGGLFIEPEDLPPTTTEIAGAIRAAAADDRINGMYLSLDSVSGGWGSMQEVRGAIDAFREADKPCVAYAEMWGNGSYYLATGCDTVLLAPSGISTPSAAPPAMAWITPDA